MKNKLVVAMMSLSSLLVFAQDKEQAQLNRCKSGNLYEYGDHSKSEKMARFLTELKVAINSGDESRVARLVHYPLLVETVNSSFEIHSQKEFIEKYDRILPVELKAFLLKQQPRCISRVGMRGFSLGTGQIWFDEYQDHTVRIFTVNAVVYPSE